MALLVTNAAGGLDPSYAVGDIVLLNDVRCGFDLDQCIKLTHSKHINLAGLGGNHPLRGPNLADFGVRFPPLSDAYDLDLRRRTHRVWENVDRYSASRRLHEGTYAFVGGPRYLRGENLGCATS